jgi:hypothetical protein
MISRIFAKKEKKRQKNNLSKRQSKVLNRLNLTHSNQNLKLRQKSQNRRNKYKKTKRNRKDLFRNLEWWGASMKLKPWNANK